MDSRTLSEQIARILHSQTFATKTQLRKLLEVLHKNMESQAALKPEQVIQELWPAETRTKRSTDVATEMNRLRHALETYYNGEGKTDLIIIALPNRSVTAGDGRQEKRWIVAQPREDKEVRADVEQVAASQQPAAALSQPQPNPHRGLKIFSAIAALCAAVGIVSYAGIRLAAHPRPQFGRLDGTILRVTDADGKELWHKNFPDGFSTDWYYEKGPGPRIWFGDLEGKGHTSVLFSYSRAGQQPHSSTLICYSDRGKEKWRWTPGRELPELAGSPASFRTTALRVLKATVQKPPRIVVASVHDPWYTWPGQIAILDSNGKTISEYWNSGSLAYMTVADLDGDGREEIVATGSAYGYDRQATLVILDPDRVFGASSEVRPEFQIHGMGIAQERLRLLFPRSDLNRASFQFNYAIEPTFQHGNLQLTLMECPAPTGCGVGYEFDKDLHLIAVRARKDEFPSAHDRFFQNGRDAHSLSSEEKASFLKVRCLVGCKSDFVPVAQTYSPSATFERGWTTRSNPNGAWSYGYSSGLTTPITLYDKAVQNGVNGPNAQYWLSSLVDVGTSPAAEHNGGPAYNDGNVDLLADEFLLVAGIRGQYSDLVFTAPAVGEYSIAGNFRGAQNGVGTAVGIVANGKVVFKSNISSAGQLAPFRVTLNLQAGNTVVFSVGPGSGSQNTGLSATITKPCALADRLSSTLSGEIDCLSSPPVNKPPR